MAGIFAPRTITIKRPADDTGAGEVGYQGVSQASETVIADSLPALITASGAASTAQHGGLPADSPNPFRWRIVLLGAWVQSLPLIMERDIVYDDMGRRFQVSGYEPSELGAMIHVIRLMA